MSAANTTERVFRLMGYSNAQVQFIIVTPEPVIVQTVQAAWSYAVRYTAKGIDLPDHEAAVRMLLSRHPSWTLIESKTVDILVNLAIADNDVPEN
ncbi:MAG TPA: hypothetical protein VHO69_14865 [Phototrophicaceae bacterium]|nr:hypothetical protein [Phototrophicaceae bacterium]